MMSAPGDYKAIPFVEDTAVDPKVLPEFVREFDQIVRLSEKYKINLIELKDDISKQIQRELFN